MTLLDTLQREHAELTGLATQLDERIAASDLFGAHAAVLELKHALVAHVVLEDQQLYPSLVRAATRSGEGQSALTARTFAANMARVSSRLLAFVARDEAIGLAELADQWPAMKADLLARIDAEERTLYPMFRRLAEVLPAAS